MWGSVTATNLSDNNVLIQKHTAWSSVATKSETKQYEVTELRLCQRPLPCGILSS
jgi:hypothetical protein